MLAEMSSEELVYWEQLEMIEPFGERADYMRNALLCTLIANSNRAPGSTPLEMDDFMPPTMRRDASLPTEEPEEAESPEQVERSAKAFHAIMSALMQKQNGWLANQEGVGHA